MFWVVLGVVAFVFVVVTRKEFAFLKFIRDILGDLVPFVELMGWLGLFVYFAFVVYGVLPK